MNSKKQKLHVGCQYSKTCLKQPLKKPKTKICITNGSLMKVTSIAECSPWSILQYFLPALSDNWSSFLMGCFRQFLLYDQQSIYIYAYKCLCQCVGKVYNLNVNCGWFDMLGPIISENDPPIFAPRVTSAHQS